MWLNCVCVHASMCVALGQERPIYNHTIYIPKKIKNKLFFDSLMCPPQKVYSRHFKGIKCLGLTD